MTLALPFCVPLEGSEAYLERHLNDLAAEKRIVLATAEEGRLAELENKPAETATSYFRVMKLGIDLACGGRIIDALVADACESVGSTQLKKEIPKLDSQQSAAIARELEDLDAQRESIGTILENEDAWTRAVLGNGLAARIIQRFIARGIYLAFQQKAVARYNLNRRQTFELATSLAAHAFELEKGRPARNWNDLVPAYLQRIPLDPGATNQLPFSLR